MHSAACTGSASPSGTLQGVVRNHIHLTDKTGREHTFHIDDIASAKLLLTDRLINATAPLSTEGAEHIETVEE